MRTLFMMTLAIALSACSGGDSSDKPAVAGGDKDEHGCISSAGYSWCAKTQQCERPWELAEKEGFDKSEEAFSEYCEG